MTEVLIIGAGPAGLAAATAARRSGARVVVLDAAEDVGGQYWRHLPAQRPAAREQVLHHGWSRFTALRRELTGVEIVTGAQVWLAERHDDRPPTVHVLVGPADGRDREQRTFEPDALVLATGAYERTLPFPGWDLPGVFTAGAAQALAKAERVAVGRRVLVAGAGPFLLPVASSLIRTGARVVRVLEAGGWGRLGRAWTARPTELLGASHKAGELAGYVRDLARHRIPYRVATGVIAVHGRDRVEEVTVARLDAQWAPVPGTSQRVAVDAVCVSHGFLPRAELAVAAGCVTGPEGAVAVDGDCRTSVPGVFAAGEITGIGGADLALAEGTLAGTAAAGAAPTQAQRRAVLTHQRFAARLSDGHGIRPGWTGWVADDTLICRCEEVTAGELRDIATATGSRGLRSLKLSTRAGLGVCQGRVCGRSVEELLDRTTGGLLDPGRTAARPLAGLVRLGELARMQGDTE
ncbi:NAD(P)/FAD-dependent oxidoreductase [Paractinoplanes atraurantiacus]|uniref:NADPH-dependent 2,4-dienoyl-CoA reductase, sulfur reductase n=1 Tax=Paractinoplanes atraurantiacus TaxID=1036182 RepID=A0A285IIL0_9ACTN|nr:NAD(P)/FAD-dependent oxidoreductase [Actinoplanes atraurantiacus]SNY47850.1 NADPH-dependent 2,4-dienoyl-CoA reductase, sulfur reductase [Actinoplanes atraurantiacus]